jgi:uncharacterized membrane protein (DUF2068 family)
VSTTSGFLGSLALTLCGLGVVFWSGVRARMRVHLPAVACTVALLGLTIWFAERLGREYDLETAGAIKPVHLALAKLATAAYLLPLTTGVLTWRNRRWRTLHLVAACTTLLLTVAAAVTGTWMVFAAEPLQLP